MPPEAPSGSGTVGSTSGRRAGGAGAGSRSQRRGGESLGGAKVQEGKVSGPFLVSGSRFPFPAGANLWSRARVAVSRLRGSVPRRNDRRGETPRGAPPAGRSKTLKEKPHGRCGGESRRQARPGANRREGSQTLGAEVAGIGAPGEPDRSRWDVP